MSYLVPFTRNLSIGSADLNDNHINRIIDEDEIIEILKYEISNIENIIEYLKTQVLDCLTESAAQYMDEKNIARTNDIKLRIEEIKNELEKAALTEDKLYEKVKELLKNIEEETENNIINHISRFFESKHYVIEEYSNARFNIRAKDNEELCLSLHFFNNNIYVNYLGRCGIKINSGNDLLKKLDKLALSMPNIQYIELTDESTIYINDNEINLAFLKILTKGQSWYNSLEYFSSNYNNENLHNKRLCNTPLIDLLNFCKDKLIEERAKTTYSNFINYTDIFSKEKNDIEKKIESLKLKLKQHFPDIKDNLKTKNYLNEIIELIENNYEKTNDTYEKTELLNELIETIGALILYDPKLYKHIRNNSDFDKKGGKNKRKNKTKKNAKKIIKNKRKSKKYV
jgi:hypothetical protein